MYWNIYISNKRIKTERNSKIASILWSARFDIKIQLILSALWFLFALFRPEIQKQKKKNIRRWVDLFLDQFLLLAFVLFCFRVYFRLLIVHVRFDGMLYQIFATLFILFEYIFMLAVVETSKAIFCLRSNT